MTQFQYLTEKECSTPAEGQTMPERELRDEILDYTQRVEGMTSPGDILSALHNIVSGNRLLNVLGAGRFPLKFGDWSQIKIGETVFLHKDSPEGWWDDYQSLARVGYDPGLMMARISLAPYTWTESCKLLEPIGVDRWPYELALKHGMRDGLTCPVGARWVVAFWSPKVLSAGFSQQARALLFMAANFAAIRLEKLLDTDAKRIGKRANLTPRELAVLRLASIGKQNAEIAHALKLGAETTKSHLKKAQDKLGAHNRTHAVCEALRQRLIA